MSKCIGCGVKIQSTDPTKNGFVPEIALIEHGENVYCKRCHEIRNRNLKYTPENNLQNYYDKIKVIKDEVALVILMIDVMDICGGFIPNLKKYIGDNKVLILVNKVDVLPKQLKTRNLENWVRRVAKMHKLNVEGLMFISANKPSDIEKVIAKITKLKYPPKNNKQKHSKEQNRFGNCYVVGHSSVGKSTFMNQIGKLYLNYETNVITTSSQFQTTLDFIKWPLDAKSFIIDTPGIVNPHNFWAYLDSEAVDVLMPKRFIKPRTYQLNPNQTIFLGGLARVDFSGISKINASFYVANQLYIHRTKTVNATNIYETQLGKLLVPTLKVEDATLSRNQTHVFEIKKPSDIFISGIGFIHLTSDDAKVEITLPDVIEVKMMENEEC